MEFGPQIWSIDLFLVIVERGDAILGVLPPWGATPHPPRTPFTTKMEIIEAVNLFFSTLGILTRAMSALNGQSGVVDRHLEGVQN